MARCLWPPAPASCRKGCLASASMSETASPELRSEPGGPCASRASPAERGSRAAGSDASAYGARRGWWSLCCSTAGGTGCWSRWTGSKTDQRSASGTSGCWRPLPSAPRLQPPPTKWSTASAVANGRRCPTGDGPAGPANLPQETLQSLAALRLGLASQLQSPDPESMTEAIRQAVAQLECDLGRLRSLIADPRPVTIDKLGIAAAIEDLAECARSHGPRGEPRRRTRL